MNNWIDLSNIPTKPFGNSFAYDWKKSINCICNFSCEGITGTLKIVGYNPKVHKLSISYTNQIKKIHTDFFKAGKLQTLIGLRSGDFKISVGTIFEDEHRNIVITAKKRLPDSNGRLWKAYQYHCNVCNWDDGVMNESHVIHGIGCSCCNKKTIVPYINDLYTTNPELIKYFKNIEDTHKTTSCSKKKFLMVCPNCGNEQLYSTDDLMNHGFACKKCGDGVSYGEKYLYSLLKQLNVDFIAQLTHTTFDWCGKYRYDFYISKINTIVEVHGMQHYSDNNEQKSKFTRCLINDPIKEKLAKENNISHYICIDCSKSNGKFIKNSIINSALLNVLSVKENDIDWDECDRFTSKSFVTIACDYKNKYPELSSKEIGKIFGISGGTVQKYLQKGAELGICIYDKDFEKKRPAKTTRILYYKNKYVENVS